MRLTREYIVLVCLLLLPAAVYAWPNQAQYSVMSHAPREGMTSTSSHIYSCRTSQSVVNTTGRSVQTKTLSTGRFTAYVPELDANGYAVAPTQIYHPGPMRQKKDERDEGDDPSEPMMPAGDTPWILFSIFALVYAIRKRIRSLLPGRS